MSEDTTPPGEAAPDKIQSGLDLSRFRVPGERLIEGASPVNQGLIEVRKPGRRLFLRVHPTLAAPVHLLEDEVDRRVQLYLVTTETVEAVPELRSDLRPFLLRFYCARDNALGDCFAFWPLKLDTDPEKVNTWNASARQVANQAVDQWVRLVSDQTSSTYQWQPAAGDLGEVEWPKESLQVLLERAFRQRIIDDRDHPVVRRLTGRL